ncbi:probable receptor-like protein kinase At2g23200 [Rutidosis leptorrhynchoides]|uniref:probable receptor-like protein kinase At2g23200 n=1 Tax=Rutidosis leptorrhynchoides TaxID=125765 RepID=UPI003A98DB73
MEGRNLDHLKFKFSDIKAATDDFSDICQIGSGGYANVYKAELEHFDGINSLAVEGYYKGGEGFLAEIEMLSKCKHPNIVCLLGFCDEGSEMILVYEYASNGSLDAYMRNEDNMIRLSWAKRIQICIDIANGLSYLHTPTEDKQTIIHRDIKSANVLLSDKMVAKIADFGLSKLQNAVQLGSTLVTKHIAGTKFYLDPDYESSGKLKTKSDIYSFGVVLFELMCGKLAYHKAYGEKGLPSIARRCFKNGTIMELVDPLIYELEENMLTLNGGVNQDSLDTFSKVAYQCVAETQSERPRMELVIAELEKALNFQKNSNSNLHMSLETIITGTQNFSDENCIGSGKYWKLYEGKVSDASNANGCTFFLAKRWDSKSGEGHDLFWNELEVLSIFNNHDNIIGLFGYCDEFDERIIVYKHASNGRLDKHLDDSSLTWMKRLKIGINIASGLKYLHTSSIEERATIMHTNLKSSAVLLDNEWIAKISNLELSRKSKEKSVRRYDSFDGYYPAAPIPHDFNYVTQESDIYPLGVILLEMLCGKLAWGKVCKDHNQSLGPVCVRHYGKKRSLNKLVFQGIKEQIAPKSLAEFQRIAIMCLTETGYDLPKIKSIVRSLNKALKLQEDHDMWELKLPSDYTEIINALETPEKYSRMKMKADLYELFVKGILLQDGKLVISLLAFLYI